MYRSLVLLTFVFLLETSCKASSACEQKIAESYLDTAVDMIAKAKSNFPTHCESNATKKALDCSELLESGYNESGIYTIWPANRVMQGKSLEVYCDMETDGGGWTLIQRRGNFGRPVDYFYKDWKSYKEGFGDIGKEFWLGNDNIFALSNQKLYSARFDLKDVEKNAKYAQYDTFWIDDEYHKYMVHVFDYEGNAGDSFLAHSDKKFSTKDQDNDREDVKHCAQVYKGGWWFNTCHYSNLNGLNFNGKHESYGDGINWKHWKGYHESLESTEIKLRPKDFKMPHVPLNETPM